MIFDFIFPPLCLACRERCTTRSLCPDCWQLCAPPDPAERCRHCFEELDRRGTLCSQCRRGTLLPALRAYVFDPESPARYLGLDPVRGLAGFALLQWVQLEWPWPDAIVPMPDALALGKAFARLIDRPLVRALRPNGSYREDRLEENSQILLIDISSPLEILQRATAALSESFPKRVFLLTLFPYDFSPI